MIFLLLSDSTTSNICMIKNKKIVVVLPAYNAELTLEKTYNEIPHDIVDDVVLVDDKSSDRTADVAREIGIRHIIRHESNKGYGGNQKTCYDKALDLGGDIIVMLHPDYQYEPGLIHSMAYLIGKGIYPVVLGSRILGNGALKGGMPIIKYVSNRLLTLIQNMVTGQKLSEYHTGYRAFAKEVLKSIPYHKNSNSFVFDNQMLCQIIYKGFEIAEITCPTKYFKEASSINLKNSIIYAIGVLITTCRYALSKSGIYKAGIFRE